MAHQVIICHHLLDAVGEGEGDREGETLRHSHHQHRHPNNHKLHIEVDVVQLPGRTLQYVKEILSKQLEKQ